VSVLGKVWASPNTALGVALGAIAVMLGARAQFGRNALEFLDNPLIGHVRRSAITLGNTIHYAPGRAPDDRVRRYDRSGIVSLGDLAVKENKDSRSGDTLEKISEGVKEKV